MSSQKLQQQGKQEQNTRNISKPSMVYKTPTKAWLKPISSLSRSFVTAITPSSLAFIASRNSLRQTAQVVSLL